MRVVRSVRLMDNAVELDYMDMDIDVRGKVMLFHTLVLDPDKYSDQVAEVIEAAVDLLEVALGDFNRTLPSGAVGAQESPERDDEEDDDD